MNPEAPRGSSSSGCNTGAGLVLLLLPALAFIIKKS
ncbi:MAG: SYNERG-CTERM sorting domain-containing protein [Cloacibacillus sp.]|nr:SYNERG-CTERM sorting domain-containing protein [Cloacibacillus sp.]